MPDHFYVTVKDGPRTGWCAGPFGCRAFADEAIPAVKEAARKHTREGSEGRTHFYAWGVTRVRDADPCKPIKVVFPGLGTHLLELPRAGGVAA